MVQNFCTGLVKQIFSNIISNITLEIKHLLMIKVKTQIFFFYLIIILICFIKREPYTQSFLIFKFRYLPLLTYLLLEIKCYCLKDSHN